MFVREKKNKNRTLSIQIIGKGRGIYRVAQTVGSSSDPEEITYLHNETYIIILYHHSDPARSCPILPDPDWKDQH